MTRDIGTARRRARRAALVAAAALWVSLIAAPLAAQVPRMLNYQGYLTDADGQPINGLESLTFRLYDAPIGGTMYWMETQNVIADGGLFNAVLGTVKLMPSDAFAAGERYLGITVGSDDELVPRQRVVSVGYAFAAGDSEQLGGRAADAYVRSVDGVAPQNGNVDLVAGSNVTITANPGGHSVTIASSALTLPFTSSVSSASTALTVQNTGSGYGMSASSSSSYGVRAQSGGSSGYGVYGVANGTNGRGVVGSTTGANGYGVWGSSSSHYGVYGSSSTGTGVYGKQLGSNNYGFLGSATYGAYAEHAASGNLGALGHQSYGAFGRHAASGNEGFLGYATYGVYGEGGGGTSGGLGGSIAGVAGDGDDVFGVLGVSTDSDGVRGHGYGGYGVHGLTDDSGHDAAGVYGETDGAGAGVRGQADDGRGVYGVSANGTAVFAEGDLAVTGAYRGSIDSSSGHDGAPFPRPAFDSGWFTMAPKQERVLEHGIGGDPDDYVVDLQFLDPSLGRNNLGLGGDVRPTGNNYGGFYRQLTNASISVDRMDDAASGAQMRVRIWVVQ